MLASSITSAPAAAPSCGRSRAIAACSVLTARFAVRRCKPRKLAVAPHEHRRSVSRLAGRRVEQLTGNYEWVALGVVIVSGGKLIWWATERAWGKFS
jgi:hypothetical protein